MEGWKWMGGGGSGRAEVNRRKIREWKGGNGWAEAGVEGRKWMDRGRSRRAEADGHRQEWKGGSGWATVEDEGRKRKGGSGSKYIYIYIYTLVHVQDVCYHLFFAHVAAYVAGIYGPSWFR